MSTKGNERKKAVSSKKESSPTKSAEARARKQDDLSTADMSVKGESSAPEKAIIPIGVWPEDRIR